MTTRSTNHGGETISGGPIGTREDQANQQPADVIGRGEEGGRDVHREKEREREGGGKVIKLHQNTTDKCLTN